MPVLNVLLVVASGAPGGGTTHVLNLARRLDPARFRVSVSCGTDGDLATDITRLGLDAFGMDFMRSRFNGSAWRQLARLIDRLGPDVVHAHGSRAALAAAVAVRLLVRRRPRPRAIYTEHGLPFDQGRGLAIALPAACAEAAVGLMGARAIALSNHAKVSLERLRTFAGVTWLPSPMEVPPPEQRVARRAAARRALGIPDDEPEVSVVGTVIRLVPQKAPERFVDLAARVAAARPQTHFVLVGDGPLRSDVEHALLRANLGDRFHLAGFRPDAAKLMAAFDVFALLSRWEGLPIAALEAQAEGLPVVGSAVGGLTELLSDGRGAAVPSGDQEAAAAATLRWLNDPVTAAKAGQIALENIQTVHHPDRFVARMEATYEGD